MTIKNRNLKLKGTDNISGGICAQRVDSLSHLTICPGRSYIKVILGHLLRIENHLKDVLMGIILDL